MCWRRRPSTRGSIARSRQATAIPPPTCCGARSSAPSIGSSSTSTAAQTRAPSRQEVTEVESTAAGKAGTLSVGGLEVARLGFGAMGLLGPDVWGEPDDVDEAKRVL